MNATHQRLLFVIPRYDIYEKGRYIMPLGILYVSAAAKTAGCDVLCLNLNHEDDAFAKLSCIIENCQCTMVAVGGLSGEYSDIYPVLDYVKSEHPRVITLVGGGIITSTPMVAMKALKHADVGMIGEGDETIVELYRAIQEGTPLSNVKGIIYREGDRFVITSRRRDVPDLNSLPYPDYEGFDFARYLSTNNLGSGYKGEPLSPVNIIGSRSCPYLCSFCFHPSGRTYRERSLDSIFSEIDYLLEHYPSINHIAMREELFASRPDRIRRFCERIVQYNLYWTMQLRVDNVTESVLDYLAAANCFAVFIGTESMDDQVLRSMNKHIKAAQSQQVLQMAHEKRVPVRTGLIFGDKAETIVSYTRTLDWYEKNQIYSDNLRSLRITVDMLIPFPGTRLYQYACGRGIIHDEIEYLRMGCPVVNLTSMNEADFLDMMRKIQQINGRSYNYLSNGICREITP